MTKLFLCSALLFFAIGCNRQTVKKEITQKNEKQHSFRLYAKSIADSFTIFVNLPNDYNPGQQKTYPVVYLLDANLYFDIIATTIDKYSDVGLAPPVLLVGIGYKDFQAMDSLRNRDDTYPVAIPEYEMTTSGGADQFLSFINDELIPQIDKTYKTDTAKRVLMGHSLAGYFTLYAVLRDLAGQSNSFSSYIAASPSLHYNHYYLLKQLNTTVPQKNRQRKIKTYITYGGEEDSGDTGNPDEVSLKNLTAQLSELLSEKQSGNVMYKSDIYSNLGHMDTQIPTFIKGLQWTLGEAP